MAPSTVKQICRRIIEHCGENNKKYVKIIFHGGEPTIGGPRHLQSLLQTIEECFSETAVEYSLGMQTNGTLLTKGVIEALANYRMSIGISLDGPPRIQDRHRLDHAGRGSSALVEKGLKLLRDEYPRGMNGFLTVVDLQHDPEEIIDYFAKYEPREIDFLLPYDNWDRWPVGKRSFDDTIYADWLIRAFDYWYFGSFAFGVREFTSIMRLLLGHSSLVESIGLGPVDIVVIETNGEIEAVDSLKAAYNGATKLGFNVFDHCFDDAATDLRVYSRHLGIDSLCNTCQECSVVDYCGGGYLPTRYSSSNGFQNPSIYCRDLEKLIRHIHRRVSADIEAYAA